MREVHGEVHVHESCINMINKTLLISCVNFIIVLVIHMCVNNVSILNVMKKNNVMM